MVFSTFRNYWSISFNLLFLSFGFNQCNGDDMTEAQAVQMLNYLNNINAKTNSIEVILNQLNQSFYLQVNGNAYILMGIYMLIGSVVGLIIATTWRG